MYTQRLHLHKAWSDRLLKYVCHIKSWWCLHRRRNKYSV